MKKILLLTLIFLPLIISGQVLDCCKSVNEIESNLEGYWKINDSISKIHYRFQFENGQGNLTILELIEDGYIYKVLDDHPFLEIIESDDGFRINFTDLKANRTSELKYLDLNKMILNIDGKEIEYCKVKD